MTINPILKTIRTKKLGVLMRDARLASGKSLEECAQALGIPDTTLEAYEYGENPPTLPELEMLAYYLQIPLEHFWGNETLKKDGRFAQKFNPEQVKGLRQRVIGAIIRKTRLDAGLSEDTLAEKVGLSPEHLVSYELGETSVPLPELEAISQALNVSIRDFQDQHGPAGTWFLQQHVIQDFSELPSELQSFVCKPVNRPYLELAQRLSEMQVEKLRAVAEGLLEITL
jgi:transcriptional regulator with XRE-family HTH domain